MHSSIGATRSIATSQEGVVLVTSLILLLILTIVGITAMRTSTLEERMAANGALQMRAFQAANSAVDGYISGLLKDYTEDNDSSALGAIAAGDGSTETIALRDAEITATAEPAYLGQGLGIGHSIGVGSAGIASHRFEFIGSSELQHGGARATRAAVAAGISVLGPSN
ncbi:MAG: PilX N-terminal domain-containing pilus assembly protein [Aquisalimonadaceae bacterium]